MLSNQRLQSFRMRRNHFIQVIYSLWTARDTQRTRNKLLSQPALFRPILIDYTVNIVFTLQLMKIDELEDLKRPMSYFINPQIIINQDVNEIVLLNEHFMNNMTMYCVLSQTCMSCLCLRQSIQFKWNKFIDLNKFKFKQVTKNPLPAPAPR